MPHNPQAYEATVARVPAAVVAALRPRPDPDHPSVLAQRIHDRQSQRPRERRKEAADCAESKTPSGSAQLMLAEKIDNRNRALTGTEHPLNQRGFLQLDREAEQYGFPLHCDH
jgi:hypothetical protein